MDQPISQLPIATTLTGVELIPIVQNGITKQAQTSQLANVVSPGKLISSAGIYGSNILFNYSDGTTSTAGPVVATVAIGTTTTLPAGSSATVTNSGSSANGIFNFGIPVGATGAGVAAGGTTGQVLAKASATNYDTTWVSNGDGTVTSVTATSPVTSTGGATPVIAMPAATTSANGYLSSTDWTTFNNKLSTQVYPGAGIPNSTGSAWGTSYGTTGTGSVVLSNSPTITGNVNIGVSQFGNVGISTSDNGGVQNNNFGTSVEVINNIGGESNDNFLGSETIFRGKVYFQSSAYPLWDSCNIQMPLVVASLNVSGALTATNSLQLTGLSSSNQNIATAQTTGTLNIGGTSATGAITLGRSTGAQTVNIATGVTAASTTKAVNIGTAGNATSTTNIAIGATTGTSTTTLNGAVTLSATTQALNLGTNQTTGAINIGGSGSTTGAITIGQSTDTQKISIGSDLVNTVSSGATRTINIGTTASGTGVSNVTIGRASTTVNHTTTVRGRYVTINASTTLSLVTGGALVIGQNLAQTTTSAESLGDLTEVVTGSRAFVTDALAPVFGSLVVGGGAVAVPVYYDGTDWRVG